ncbi:MAG: response regulator [Rhodospirillales bacterium]|nr:response regulator [Rhodospirillales bacterium]MCW8861714.1 response regulator [Rhodospirillales bacterium]MCW9040692.1 response regulator [Rhodospirillales bacterium]
MAGMDLSDVKFLIVDDNAFMRVLIRRILNACGCREIEEAGDGAEAFTVMQSFKPDVIITDYNMQPLDGLDFIRLVRTAKDSPNQFIPVILITAYAENFRIKAARDAGVTEILVKPVSAKALFERLEAIFHRPRPFVKAHGYFGPDRRRRMKAAFMGHDRREFEPVSHPA